MPLSTWLSVRFFLFFATWAVFIAYWGRWLLGRGFDVGETGLSITAGLVTRAIAVAVIYPVVSRRVSVARLAKLLPWVSAAVATLFLPEGGFGWLVIVSMVFGLVYPMIMPLTDTIATVNANAGRVGYARVRLWGSIGFIGAALGCGLAVRWFGTQCLGLLFACGCLVMAVVSLVEPAGGVGPVPPAADRGWRGLFADRTFVLVLAISALLQGAHGAYYAFGAVALRDSGLSEVAVSGTIVLAVVGEVVLFRYASTLFAGMSVARMFQLAAVASLVRWGVLSLSTGSTAFLATQLLHAATFAVAHLAVAHYIRDHLRQDLAAAAHGMNGAVAMSLAGAAFTALAGVLYSIRPTVAFLAMALACAPALVLCALLNAKEPPRFPGAALPSGTTQ